MKTSLQGNILRDIDVDFWALDIPKINFEIDDECGVPRLFSNNELFPPKCIKTFELVLDFTSMISEILKTVLDVVKMLLFWVIINEPKDKSVPFDMKNVPEPAIDRSLVDLCPPSTKILVMLQFQGTLLLPSWFDFRMTLPPTPGITLSREELPP